MRYYITSDVHGYYTLLREALAGAGYFEDATPHKLVVAGDLFDRGSEAVELQGFVLGLMERGEVILVRGNHEDLYVALATTDHGLAYQYHRHNGTYDTALQLTGMSKRKAMLNPLAFAAAMRETPYYKTIIPAMLDYYETRNYIITHGWIPCVSDGTGCLACIGNWRETSERRWREARWFNGMDAVRTAAAEKTIICGHWHTSYGHSKYEGKGSEFGADADFSPYLAQGIIALDACTAHSGIVNCVVIEDEET